MANDRPVSLKTKEYRKVVKPLLERRRRARINGCLNELRNFILDATKQDSVQASKLEKADILEMTVHYLRLLLRQQCVITASNNSTNTSTTIDSSSTDVGRFRAGFTECVNEVSMFVASNMSSTVNPQVKTRLLGHLSKCLNHMEHISAPIQPMAQPEVLQTCIKQELPPPLCPQMINRIQGTMTSKAVEGEPTNKWVTNVMPRAGVDVHNLVAARPMMTSNGYDSLKTSFHRQLLPQRGLQTLSSTNNTILVTVVQDDPLRSPVWRPW